MKIQFSPKQAIQNSKLVDFQPHLDRTSIDHFVDLGINRCLEERYKSWISGESFKDLVRLFENSPFPISFTNEKINEPFAVVVPIHSISVKPETPHKYDLTSWGEVKMQEGSYLRIFIGYSHEIDIEVVRRQILSVTEVIRSVFGDSSLVEHDYEIIWTLDLSSRHATMEKSINTLIPANDFANLGEFFDVEELIADSILDFDPEAVRFLSLSYHQSSVSDQFHLTWIALEKQLGDGMARKNFFEGKMRSWVLSKEIRRLHNDVRGSITHKQKTADATSRDLQLLRMALRMAATNDEELRQKYLRSCEMILAKHP